MAKCLDGHGAQEPWPCTKTRATVLSRLAMVRGTMDMVPRTMAMVPGTMATVIEQPYGSRNHGHGSYEPWQWFESVPRSPGNHGNGSRNHGNGSIAMVPRDRGHSAQVPRPTFPSTTRMTRMRTGMNEDGRWRGNVNYFLRKICKVTCRRNCEQTSQHRSLRRTARFCAS